MPATCSPLRSPKITRKNSRACSGEQRTSQLTPRSSKLAIEVLSGVKFTDTSEGAWDWRLKPKLRCLENFLSLLGSWGTIEEAMDSSDDLWRSVWDFWIEKKYIISSWEDGERGGGKTMFEKQDFTSKIPQIVKKIQSKVPKMILEIIYQWLMKFQWYHSPLWTLLCTHCRPVIFIAQRHSSYLYLLLCW